jgi:hypothetical protein
MRLIGETIKSVTPSKPWNERVLLGFWIVSSQHNMSGLDLTFNRPVTSLCAINTFRIFALRILGSASHMPGNF